MQTFMPSSLQSRVSSKPLAASCRIPSSRTVASGLLTSTLALPARGRHCLSTCNALQPEKDGPDGKPVSRDVSVHSISEGSLVSKQAAQVLGDEISEPVPLAPFSQFPQNVEAETFVTNQGLVEPVAMDDDAEALQSLWRRVHLLNVMVHSIGNQASRPATPTPTHSTPTPTPATPATLAPTPATPIAISATPIPTQSIPTHTPSTPFSTPSTPIPTPSTPIPTSTTPSPTHVTPFPTPASSPATSPSPQDTSVSKTGSTFDFLGESTEGDLHVVQRMRTAGMINVLGLERVSDILEVPTSKLTAVTQTILDAMEVPTGFPAGDPQRAIYCSRTLNVRSIKAIGYDMDYTLIHYDVDAWEGRAYAYGLESLREQGCPVDGLQFDSDLVIRGLIMDKELGNLVKVDRFGLVKRGMHGTRMLSWNELRDAYGREVVNLRNEGRWVFLNTLFSVSEAVIYTQLVDRLDSGMFDATLGNITYQQLYKMVSKALYRTHVEGKLKAEIIKEPEKYVELDPEMAATLLDQKDSGKLLLLITNSDYEYTDQMMTFAYDRFLPNGMKWRDLFDMVVVMARKPDFFNYNMSLYEVVTESGLMRPALAAKRGGLYCGGSARMVESALGIEGDDFLYVGDHIYTDAALAKINFRWRTALIIREMEQEVDALAKGRPHRERLLELMTKKEVIGDLFNQLRLARQRALNGRRGGSGSGFQDEEAVNETLAQLLVLMDHLDQQLGPMLASDGSHFNRRWGYLSRAGLNDKSQLCRQIEKYADIYTSRVANFLRYSPYQYFRSPSQSLAHDRHWMAETNGSGPVPFSSSSSRFLSYSTFTNGQP